MGLTIRILCLTVCCFFYYTHFHTRAHGDTARSIEKPVRQSIKTRQATQKAEEEWRLEKEKLVSRFEALQEKEKSLRQQRKEMIKNTNAARERLVLKEKKLKDIEAISNQIRPFLDELMEGLKSSISNDLPFLSDERSRRVKKLDKLINDPEAAVSEKYRKIMEAFLVEAEYGFTIETTRETIMVNKQTMLTDIFRLGRISLFYHSLDRKHCGFYNVSEKKWQPLPASYRRDIQIAIDIAAKRRPVELLTLPLGRMVIP